MSGRPSSRPVQGAAARSGGQGRRRLAPGPDPREATRSACLGASMASTGRTRPLPAASTAACAALVGLSRLSTHFVTNYRKTSGTNYRVVHQSARGLLHQSARGSLHQSARG